MGGLNRGGFDMVRPSLLDHFSALRDPRQLGKVVYPLPEIMLLVLCATLAGAEDFVEVRHWGRKKLPFLRTMLPYGSGIPSHDTLNDVMNALDGDLFSEIFGAWVEGLREDEPDIVAIDGKTSRRSHSGDRHPLHVVSAWAARQRLVLGQQATDAKSNEITAIPLLLARLQLTGALVTIDAMGAQTKIAQTILSRGADYLLALKDNQRSLADEVALFFDTREQRSFAPSRPSMPITGASKPAATGSATTWPGSTVTAALPANRASPASRPSPWSRPTVERGGRTHLAPLLHLLAPLDRATSRPRRPRPLGHRKPAALGASTSSSTTTSCGSEPTTDPETWPQSNTWP
jgi:hypothetical protein